MSAPMLSISSGTKKSLKKVLLAELFIVIALVCIIFIPLNTSSNFDIIFNSLWTSKLLAVFCLMLHSLLEMFMFTATDRHTLKPVAFLKACFKGAVLMLISVVLFHCIFVLFGAAFFENTAETFHLALVVGSTSVAPAIIHLGTSVDKWLKVFIFQSSDQCVETMVFYTSVCSVLGVWLGALPIPLDWDRPWQVWPITCVLGTVLGHCAGLLLSAIQIACQISSTGKYKAT
ncbi:phosphatidylinositol-glycan biosynthesis class F protein-like [Mya arenaria]|uniref:phosphatidylinositol-glycan biosynthesis class F protein-like n=1 Tax=Mya arenaria TaxID=6604 RepID=UPI0022E3CB85|nr:phosphatidylinositol-glycan biosynthesis class F protein-like [Mya arenaria]